MKRKSKFIISGVGAFALSLSFLQERKKHYEPSQWQTKTSSDETLDFKKDQRDPGGGKQKDDSSLGKDSGSDKSSQDDKTLGPDDKDEKVVQDESKGGDGKYGYPTLLGNFNLITNFRKTFYQKYGESYLKKGLFKQQSKLSFEKTYPKYVKKYSKIKEKEWIFASHPFKYDKTFDDWYNDDNYDDKLSATSLWKDSGEYKEWSKLKSQKEKQKINYFRKWKWQLENVNKLNEFYASKIYWDYHYDHRRYQGSKTTQGNQSPKYGITLQPQDFTTRKSYTNKFDLILFEKELAKEYKIDISQAAFLKWVKKDYNTNHKTGILKYFWTQSEDYQYNNYKKTLTDEQVKSYEEFLRGYGGDWKTYDDTWKGYDEYHRAYREYLDAFDDEQIKELDEYNYFLWSQLYLHQKSHFDDVYKKTISTQDATKTLDYSVYKWHKMRDQVQNNLASLPFKKVIPMILKPEEISKVKTDFLTSFTVDDKKFANWFNHGYDPKSVFELLTKGIYDQNNNLLLKFDLVYYKHLPLHQQQSLFYSWFRKNKSQLKGLSTTSDDLKLLIGKNDYHLKLWEEIKTHIKLFQIKTKGLQKDEVLKWYKDPKQINKVKQIFLASAKSDDTFAKINQKIANKEIGGPNYLPLSWDQFIRTTMSKVWNLKIATNDSEIVKLIKQDMEVVKIVEEDVDYDYHHKTYFYPKKVFALFWKENQKYIREQNSYDHDKFIKDVIEHYQSRLAPLKKDKRKYWKDINDIKDLWASNSLNKYEEKKLGLDEKSVAIYKEWYREKAFKIMNLLHYRKKSYEGKNSWYKIWDKFWTPKSGGRTLGRMIQEEEWKLDVATDKEWKKREKKKFFFKQIDKFAKSHMKIIKEMFHHKGLFTDEELVFSIAPSHESGYTKYFRELNFDKWVTNDWELNKIVAFFKEDHPSFKFNFSQEDFGKWITSDARKATRLKLHKYSRLNIPQIYDYLGQIIYHPQKFMENIEELNSWIMNELKTSNQPWFGLSKEKLGGNVPYFLDEINKVEEYVKYNQQAYQQSGQEDKDYESWLYNWSIILDDKHYNVYTKESDGSDKLLWDANEWRNSLERKQIAFESIRNPEELKKVFSKWFKEFVQRKNRTSLVKPLEEFVESQFSVWFKKFVSTNYVALFDDIRDKDGKKIDYHLIHQWPKTNILLKEFINARKYSALKSYVLSQDANGFKEFIDGKDPAWFKDFVKSRGVVLFKTFIRSHDRPWFDQFTKDKEIFIKEFKGPLLKTLKAIYHSPHLIYDDKKGSRIEVKPVIKYWAYSDPQYSQAQVDYYQWVAQQMGTKLKELVTLKKYQLWSGKKFTSLEKYYQDVIIAWTKHSFAPFEIFLKDFKQ